MSTCTNRHPEHPQIVCENTAPLSHHPLCTGFDHADLMAEWVDWPNPDYVPPVKLPRSSAQSRLKALAGRIPDQETLPDRAGFSAGLRGSAKAAGRWDDAQKRRVMAAIDAVAKRHAGGGEFTSDEIWAELDGAVPVTKGLTALLMRARKNGVLDSTGHTEISRRGGDHDHGQRLTRWYSLL